MPDARRLYQVISIIERQHGLTELDASARALLDLIVAREMNGEKTSARELIQASGIARAVVYRKLNALKRGQWIQDDWSDFKLCYTTASKFETLVSSFKEQISKVYV